MEGFFYITCGDVSEWELIDSIGHRYGWTIDQIRDLGASDLYHIYRQVRIEKRRTEAREQWIAMLPLMLLHQVKYMEWNDYYDQVSGRTIDLRPDAEILADVAKVREELKGG